jgi:hypothetical protein
MTDLCYYRPFSFLGTNKKKKKPFRWPREHNNLRSTPVGGPRFLFTLVRCCIFQVRAVRMTSAAQPPACVETRMTYYYEPTAFKVPWRWSSGSSPSRFTVLFAIPRNAGSVVRQAFFSPTFFSELVTVLSVSQKPVRENRPHFGRSLF